MHHAAVRRAAALAIALAAIAAPAVAKPTSGEILKRMAGTYRKMQSYRDRTVTTMSMKMQGMSQQMEVVSTLSFARPNRLRLEMKRSAFASTTVCDGKNLWMYMPQSKQVMKSPLPPGMQKNLGQMGAMNMVLQAVATEDPLKTILTGVKSHRLVGTQKVGAVDAYLVEMNQPNLGIVKLWIGTRDSLLYKASVDSRKGIPTPQAGPSRTTFTEVHKEIQVNPRLPASTFTFTPPPGVKVVNPSTMGGRPGGRPAGRPMPPPPSGNR